MTISTERPSPLGPPPLGPSGHDIVHWANVAQHRASDPLRSVWVNASAGTGKTKVLVERVLRLLLPRHDGSPGIDPHRILCLTYTKAAAAEMTERLLKRVSDWAVMSEDDLTNALHAVFDRAPTDTHRKQARQLFSKLVDSRDQLRIMTIHAFCQSVLSRFPLEAGISPNFTLIEGEERADLFDTARKNAMMRLSKDPRTYPILQKIGHYFSDGRLKDFVRGLWTEVRQLTSALGAYTGENREKAFRQMLGLAPLDTVARWQNDVADLPDDFIYDLKILSEKLGNGTIKERKIATQILDWVNDPPRARADTFQKITRAFFKTNGDRQEDGHREGVRRKDDSVRILYMTCGDRMAALWQKRKMLGLLDANTAMFQMVDAIIHEYERLKHQRGVLDFDDLIRKTNALLRTDADQSHRTQTPSWVMYKLDGGIDHILVDEAQDTNAEQWQTIATLAGLFDPSDPTRARSLFIVGDQKQSIYRFQGADPDTFETMLDHFGPTPGQTSHTLHLDKVILNTSFRSTTPVLSLVDHIFSTPEALHDLRMRDPLVHLVSRTGQAGRVDLWPLVPHAKEKDDPEPWAVPVHVKPVNDGPQILSRRIARHIHTWLDQKTILPSHNRPIEPRDIMILVRKRRPFLAALRAALRAENIPVSDADRRPILDSLTAQDMIALAQFILLPSDDYALACVLKTPLIGGDDNDLLCLAPKRSRTLWDAVQENAQYKNWADYLKKLIAFGQTQSPFAFFGYVLDQPCPACPVGTGRRAYAQSNAADHMSGLDDVLSAALSATQSGQTLTSFVHNLVRDNPETRSVDNSADNVVRLMTVHGSKGLESPIVILPDTIRSTQDGTRHSVFWPEDTDAPLPLWVPRAADRPEDIPGVIARVKEADRAEEQRLLYVALTRAQDWLIVAGADKERRATSSWYDTILDGIKRCAAQDGYMVAEGPDGPIYTLQSDQTAKPDRAAHTGPFARVEKSSDSDQEYLKRLACPIMPEPPPLRPYRASAPGAKNKTVSPLDVTAHPTRFTRGLVTHKLLEILPHLPVEKWAEGARSYVTKAARDLPLSDQDGIVSDVMGVLNHPEFKFLFTPEARAEVPVTGLLPDGRLIAGQMDRLCVRDTVVYILDYKTGARVPSGAADIPASYIGQMRTYRDLVAQIYPRHRVKCLLLYTFGPVMMDVTDQL